MIHQINIIIHVTAGSFALLLGTILLFKTKGTHFHRAKGMYFVYLLTIVTVSGFIGWLFFRSNAFLLMLTVLAGYNTFAGYRIVKRKQLPATWFDQFVAFSALASGLFYWLWLLSTDSNWSPSVIYPTVSGIVFVTVYDICKRLFFHEKLKTWWLYEHIYKIVSAFSAIFSAFVGTVLPNFKPYSQIGPSSFCLLLIFYFIWKESRREVTVKHSSLGPGNLFPRK